LAQGQQGFGSAATWRRFQGLKIEKGKWKRLGGLQVPGFRLQVKMRFPPTPSTCNLQLANLQPFIGDD